jgi:hypothetical protein
MDLEETEAKNDYADESQQQFNRPTDRSTEAVESTALGAVTKQRLVKTAV